MDYESLREKITFRNALFLVAGFIVGIVGILGFIEIIMIIELSRYAWLGALFCLIVSVLVGMLYGSLLILHDIMFPSSKYKIIRKLNPLKDEELDLLYLWSRGASVKDLNIHPMQLNRILRKYVKSTLQKRNVKQN